MRLYPGKRDRAVLPASYPRNYKCPVSGDCSASLIQRGSSDLRLRLQPRRLLVAGHRRERRHFLEQGRWGRGRSLGMGHGPLSRGHCWLPTAALEFLFGSHVQTWRRTFVTLSRNNPKCGGPARVCQAKFSDYFPKSNSPCLPPLNNSLSSTPRLFFSNSKYLRKHIPRVYPRLSRQSQS